MLVADADGGVLWYNQRWYEYTGSTPEQMNGWGWRSVHDPQVLPRVLERWKDSIASGEPFNMVFPPRGADGMFHPFLTRVMPVRNRDRKVVRWFGTNTDITEQQNSEAALREALELRQIAMRAAKLGAWEWRVGSGEVVWDENSQNMFGIQPGERSDYDAAIARIHPEDRARLTAAIQRAVEGANGGTFHNEFQVVWPNGSVHWVGATGNCSRMERTLPPSPISLVSMWMSPNVNKRKSRSRGSMPSSRQ